MGHSRDYEDEYEEYTQGKFLLSPCPVPKISPWGRFRSLDAVRFVSSAARRLTHVGTARSDPAAWSYSRATALLSPEPKILRTGDRFAYST